MPHQNLVGVALTMAFILFIAAVGCGEDPAKPLLQSQLPADVAQEFFETYYWEPLGDCGLPPLEGLKVVQEWLGDGDSQIVFAPPAVSPIEGASYFLVVVGEPTEKEWWFDSVVEAGTEGIASLHLESAVPQQLGDAQMWCSQDLGVPLPNKIRGGADGLLWALYLIAEAGTGDSLPVEVTEALDENYYGCPPVPPIGDLQVSKSWFSDEVSPKKQISFSAPPQHYFLAVEFKPTEPVWYFNSVELSPQGSMEGPFVSNRNGERIGFTGRCIMSTTTSTLEIDAKGGDWMVHLITQGKELR